MKTLYFLLLFFPIIYFSQVLDEYPKGQTFYKGGLVNFYKEAHELLIKNNAKECAENEIYVQRILITADAKVKVVKDTDTINISKNKCAYNLSMTVLKGLKNWNTAEVKGGKFGAIADFIFYPKDLMSGYKDNYNPYQFVKNAEYEDGFATFDKLTHDNFMSLFQDYHINADLNLEFYINENGKIINPRIYPTIDNQEFNKEFFRTLQRLNKKWKPATYSNLAIKQRVAFPWRFTTTYRDR